MYSKSQYAELHKYSDEFTSDEQDLLVKIKEKQRGESDEEEGEGPIGDEE